MTAAVMALHMLAIFYTASLVVSTGGIHFLLAGGDNFVSVAAKPARRGSIALTVFPAVSISRSRLPGTGRRR